MEDKDDLRDITNELIQEMKIWNKSHPEASFLEIEVKARSLASKLEARLIQDSAQEREKENGLRREGKDRPTCPNCHVPLLSRGKRMRRLQGTAGREIQLERTYMTCPQCGAGFFPLR